MEALPHRKHGEVLRAHLPLAGARVLDVGCGDGALVRLMTRAGARVTGLEISRGQLGRALAAEPAGAEDYLVARGEELPFADGSLDAVVFFNSLHHVPAPQLDPALAEAARVLKPGGWLYVQEPLAEGAYFELVRPVEDETAVRALAYDALRAAAAGGGLTMESELCYGAPYQVADFEAFKARVIGVEPGRAARIAALEESLRAAFESSGERRDGAFHFTIPGRLNLLRKVT